MLIEKYICENNIVYKLNSLRFYDPVVFLCCYKIKGDYAKIRLDFLINNDLEFLVQLDYDNNFDEYFKNHQTEMSKLESSIFSKMTIQDKMSHLLAKELIMYQDLN